MSPDTASPAPQQRVVLVTGPSGAGRATAIHLLEDLDYEAIDNLPLSLVARLLDGPPIGRPIALGIDIRNREFSAAALHEIIDRLAGDPGLSFEVLFLDCRAEVLLRRYGETRRRHPMPQTDNPAEGIAREIDLLAPFRDRADVLIDTSDLSPHDLHAEIARWFDRAEFRGGPGRLSVSVQSFSYKRGVPRGLDLMFDCRFLQNPHWQPALRPLDGRAPEVAAHVAADPRYAAFCEKVGDLLALMLPAQIDEGKSHLAIGFGCTGGRHRSVAVAEHIAKALAEDGWQVSKRHRELERQAAAPSVEQQGSRA